MSVKSLANLVCESSVRTSEKVLHKELVRSLPDLLKGILAYGPNTTEKPPQFVGTSEKKIGSFLIELAQFLNVEDDKAKLILSNYLAGTLSLKLSLPQNAKFFWCTKELL